VAASDYLAGFLGQNDPNAVAAVTGVTITTNSLREALRLCNEAFEIIGGMRI